MQQTTDWLKQLFDPVAWADVHPGEILLIWLSAAALVLVGWVIASLLRRVSLRLLLGAGRIGRRFSGIAESGDPRFAKAATRVIASIVFWGVLLVFL
ncbi:MAG: hypothetical protein OEN20_13735, partial [Gammaproteobacteria bacterium]|nr:hypothetical protein [Gammaproteobacteria bacterium]